jgi:hypothetical protein
VPLIPRPYFKRRFAVPTEHGAWVLFLSPLLIGLCAGAHWTIASVYLIVAAFAGFMIRQPFVAIAKVRGGRRPATDLPAARFWITVYGAIAILHVIGLTLRGFGYLLYLALPGLPVFAWHLYLVTRKAERRQLLVEILATGALCLSATAGMWVGQGRPDALGWLLWLLTWGESVAAIVYTFLRLKQRTHDPIPGLGDRLRMGRPALLVAWGNLLGVVALSVAGVLPALMFAPFAIQAAESLWGTLNPGTGKRPRVIGIRQLIVSVLFTIVFLMAWHS